MRRGATDDVWQGATCNTDLYTDPTQRLLRRRGEVVAAEAGGVLEAVVRAARDEPVRQRELPRREAAVQSLRGRAEGEGAWSGKESSEQGGFLDRANSPCSPSAGSGGSGPPRRRRAARAPRRAPPSPPFFSL